MNREEKNIQRKRKGMRILAVLLMVVVTITSFPLLPAEVQAAGVEQAWDGISREIPEMDENGTYLIGNGAELAWFADQVNSGNGSINGKLTNYIYLNRYNTSYKWVMIGDTTDHPYQGNFDGNGQKVVYMNAQISTEDPDHRYAGLFGVIDGGNVRNLTVLGKVFHGYVSDNAEEKNDQFYAGSGGVAGYLKSGTIVNCVNYTRTTMDGDAIYRNAGGITGICEGVISRCENYGKLSTTVGIAQNHIGGIVGLLSGVNAQVTTSLNHATVQGYYCVGGIAGAVKSGAELTLSANYGAVKGNSILGGIVGRVSTTGVYSNGSTKECGVYDTYNLGTVSGYGTTAGSEIGGIAGQVGYENWKQEALPPMPVIERAYSVEIRPGVTRNGAIIGYLLSGCYGTVYGITSSLSSPNVVGAKNNRGIKILGEARTVSPDEMKSVNMLEKLGSAFTMSSAYDTDNQGYPKLVWQGLPSDILDKVDDAQLELNNWLTENNKKKYGKNYIQIESLVKTYKEKLGTITSEDELNTVMKEAREKLHAVKPGVSQDTELAEAIDNGAIALEEYNKRLLKENPELTDKQKMEMENLLTAWKEKLETASSEEDVRTMVRDGKDALEELLASFTADKKLEEVRANATEILKNYRATETYDVVWMHKIKLVRESALEAIAGAETVSEVNQLLEKAKGDIDDIISQIPETGAWDGVTKTEPETNKDGVFQITSGSELAWFADQVNQGHGDLCAELVNDISLGGKIWTPIGKSDDSPFAGSFDGMGHTIRGLYIDVEDTYVGLFGIVSGGSGQKIQNLTVSGKITVGGRVNCVGGIVGSAFGNDSNDRIEITNCHNQVRVCVSKVRTMETGVGGVAGKTENTRISNCSNEASVKIESEARGGLIYYVGGVTGFATNNSKVETSCNTGEIWGAHAAGGLIGGISGGNIVCYSSYNAADVTGLYYAGGLCGLSFSSKYEFRWCYTSGAVNLKDSGLALGAVFGKITGGNFDNLYALKRADVMGRTLVGSSGDFSASGRFISEKELKSDEMLNNLNGGGSCYIHDYLGLRNGYPILSWEMTLDDFKTGSVTALRNSVQEQDYTEENWAKVQAVIEDGAAQIQKAGDMESVETIRTQTLAAIDVIETKADVQERKLQETRDEAIAVLENYVDLSVYREEEQSQIQSLIANAKKYILLADSIEEVERHRDETRAKIDQIPDAWQYSEQVNMAAATQVDSYIMNIGEVVYTSYVKISIQIARNAYDNLTDQQKALVSTYQVLLDAEAEWARLEEENNFTEDDMELAARVDELIAAIGTVTEESQEAIETARNAYDSLTDKQKTLVAHPEILQQALETYNQLKASAVASAIAGIGEVTLDKKELIFSIQDQYDALTDEQKNLVKDYDVLKQAITKYKNLVVVQPVIEQIRELGGVENITLDSKTAIQAAIQSYNSLTGDQQELVTNYDVLEALAAAYDSLVAVDRVIRMIDAIGVVSQASGSQIQQARVAYDALTVEQQKQITNRSTLESAEAAYAALEKPQTTIDTSTDRIKGNQESLDSLRHTGSGSSDSSKNGKNTETLEEAGKNGKKQSKKKDKDAKATGESEEALEEQQEEMQDTSLPSWLEDQLDAGTQSEETENTQETQKTDKHTTLLLILLIVFGTCVILTAGFAVALYQASKKRKARQVHY